MTFQIDLLLIDDKPTDLRFLVSLLAERGLSYSVATDGDRGFWLATVQQPRLIMLDVSMPGRDGYATCRLLKAEPTTQHIPVLFLTASGDLDDRLQGFGAGACDFIQKPFHPAEVMARIAVHLRESPNTKASVAPPAVLTTETPISPTAALVRAAQKVLSERFEHPPGLDQLARLVGSNRRSLNQAFQTECQMTVFAWLRQQRLDQARAWLTQTQMPIALIADRLGFSSAANFAKAFREHFACTPSALRQNASPAADA